MTGIKLLKLLEKKKNPYKIRRKVALAETCNQFYAIEQVLTIVAPVPRLSSYLAPAFENI